MPCLQALSSVVFLVLVAHACMASMNMIDDTCGYFASSDEASYDYCKKTLGADRASATADELGLAVIAARAARATAKATRARIATLQGAETVPTRRDCLAKCAAEYDAAVRRLGRAAREAERGGSAGLKEAQSLLAEVLGAPARCDRAFTVAGQSSPLSAADRELDDAVNLASSILPSPPSTRTRA